MNWRSPMWVHVTHFLSLCDPMTFTYSHSVCDDLTSRNWSLSWKNSGVLIWKPNPFQVFSGAGFSSVILCRYVERVRGVVDTSNATMVNSPERKDVSWDMFWLGMFEATLSKILKKVRQRSVGVRCDYTVPLIISLIPRLLRVTLQERLQSGFCPQYRMSCTKPQHFPRCGNKSPTKFCIGLSFHFCLAKTWKAASRRHWVEW